MMSSFAKASSVFKTSFDVNEYFESLSASYVKSTLIRAIEENDTQLIFLLGEPGVGKTYMLNIIKEEYILQKRILFSTEPFSTPESLLYFLLKHHNTDKNLSITELKEKAISIYKNQENLIIIDEAQLLNDTVFEFIRILSDTGHFKFLISMHKDEGEEILAKKHFSSRPHIAAELDKLGSKEMLKYIHAQLFRHGMGDLTDLFQLREVKQIQKFSNGNFRTLKQMLKHTFSIMEYAKTNGYKGYVTPTKCVITMSAIDLGILDV